jgi:hypothetical protein
MNESVESVVAYCRENDRVCPLPPLWNRLWEMLPGRSRVAVGWQPPPLILAALEGGGGFSAHRARNVTSPRATTSWSISISKSFSTESITTA